MNQTSPIKQCLGLPNVTQTQCTKKTKNEKEERKYNEINKCIYIQDLKVEKKGDD
jgi:hypothetical protein